VPAATTATYAARHSYEPTREARRLRCPLMVAKLDRLSRDTHFVTGLLKHGKVQIVIAELGMQAEPLVIEIVAAVASQACFGAATVE
jgi:hypothetical protein